MTERTYGYRYSEQKGLTITQIAGRIRQDIKREIQEGMLPGAPVRYSVRTLHHSAIEITVQDWAGAWQDCDGTVPGSRDRVCPSYWCAAVNDSPHARVHQVLTEDARAVETALKRIHGAYNHNGSDIMTDHFDVNYYGTVTFEDQRAIDFRAEEAARHGDRKHAIDEALRQGAVRRIAVYGRGGNTVVHQAAEIGGCLALVCGAVLWRHSLTQAADGADITCSRCARRR